MQVILLERVENLGKIGDEVKVKNGFARNYLLPQGKALMANEKNRARFEREREAIEARNAEARAAAERKGMWRGDFDRPRDHRAGRGIYGWMVFFGWPW